jgi:hypothetical protein
MEVQNVSLVDVMNELKIIKENQIRLEKQFQVIKDEDLEVREDYMEKLNKIREGEHTSFSSIEELDRLI